MNITEAKDSPILFRAAMVLAILEDRKTQTRRIVKNLPGEPCPYQVNHHLWVRETWRTEERKIDSVDGIRFAADNLFVPIANNDSTAADWVIAHNNGRHGTAWRPSIFLPRWASRLTVEIVTIRVERLQQIKAKDILAEGAVLRPHHDKYLGKCPISAFDGKMYVDLKSLWAAGWDSINGKRKGCAWNDNPWVWVLEFRRIKP